MMFSANWASSCESDRLLKNSSSRSMIPIPTAATDASQATGRRFTAWASVDASASHRRSSASDTGSVQALRAIANTSEMRRRAGVYRHPSGNPFALPTA
jgi:hypothetical protein